MTPRRSIIIREAGRPAGARNDQPDVRVPASALPARASSKVMHSTDQPVSQTSERRGAVTILSTPWLLFGVDVALGGLAYAAAWVVRLTVELPWTQELLPQQRWDIVDHPWILLVLSQGFYLYVLGLYDDLRALRYREVLALTLIACCLQVLTITSLFFLTGAIFPRTVILLFGVVNFVLLTVWRSFVKARIHGRRLRVLVVGQNWESARQLLEDIERSPWMGLTVTGLVLDAPLAEHQEAKYPILGDFSQIRQVLLDKDVDEILFASTDSWKDHVLHEVSRIQVERPLRIAILPSVFEIAIGRLKHINLHDTPLIEVKRNPNEPIERFLKRSFDLVFSTLLLLLSLPFFLLIAAAIKLSSSGPVFYVQERIGYGGIAFKTIKFRTMIREAEADGEEIMAGAGDSRVTKVGRLLRRFRIDEMPQVINVLKGDMSFVGPRPERPGFVEEFSGRLPGYSERHKVKPGITGLAQVRGYYHTLAENKLKYDLAYIYNYSFSLDLLILLETIKVILVRRGS
jgi:exopolysaccharide biosynthesis polyprenyl glycosylphosphotransferase